ncbi:unnamed protein product, partial [Tetraodon nigroviridis]
LQPLARWWRLLPKDAAKMPESAWKLVFYTMSWSYSTYLLFFTSYSFFHDPPSVFYNWKSGMSVPTDIAIAYLIQGSFYGHSIYATIYMDAWRKDSAVMVVHHIITLALICFSYAFRCVVPSGLSGGEDPRLTPLLLRYHNVGILVLFLHDINDIQLEFSKLNIYLKSRGGGYYLLNDVLSNMGSVSFSITWSVSVQGVRRSGPSRQLLSCVSVFACFHLPQVLVPSLLVPSQSAVCHLCVQHPVRPHHPLLLLLQRSALCAAAHEYLLVPVHRDFRSQGAEGEGGERRQGVRGGGGQQGSSGSALQISGRKQGRWCWTPHGCTGVSCTAAICQEKRTKHRKQLILSEKDDSCARSSPPR